MAFQAPAGNRTAPRGRPPAHRPGPRSTRPAAPPPPFAHRHPGTVAAGTGLLAAAVGFAIGAAANDRSDELHDSRVRAASLQEALTGAEAELAEAESELAGTQDALDVARDLGDALGRRTRRQAARIERLTAAGPVPSFVGRTPAASGKSRLARDLEWTFRTRRTPSREPRGTVVAQEPAAGEKLRRGRVVTLTVAAPVPKTWTTVAAFEGASDARTAPFTLPAEGAKRIVYAFGRRREQARMRLVGMGPPAAGALLVRDAGPVAGTSRVYSGGRHHLVVRGRDWSARVQVLR